MLKTLTTIILLTTITFAYNSNLGGYETDNIYDTTPDYDYYPND